MKKQLPVVSSKQNEQRGAKGLACFMCCMSQQQTQSSPQG